MSNVQPFEYRYLQLSPTEHAVFVVHDSTPDWWRKVAVFVSKDRAESYADFENDMAGEWVESGAARAEDSIPAPADLPPVPQSALHRELWRIIQPRNSPPPFVKDAMPPPMPMEQWDQPVKSSEPGFYKIRINDSILGEALGRDGTAIPLQEAVIEERSTTGSEVFPPQPAATVDQDMVEPPEPAPAPQPAPDLIDASTLAPLTERQRTGFFACVRLHDAKEEITGKAMQREAAFSGASADVLTALSIKGYVKQIKGTYPIAYRLVAGGQPPLVPPIGAPTVPTVVPEGETNGINGDPGPGRSVLDKKNAIADLKIIEYLTEKGHEVRALGATLNNFSIDGRVVGLREILGKVNVYRSKDRVPLVNVSLYV